MVKILKNNKLIHETLTWDAALRHCAQLHKQGTKIDDLKIIGNRGDTLPITIKHLTG